MEFWGVEVKSGEPLKVAPGDGMVLHLSQACLGEIKKQKENESVCLFVQIDGKKLVLGTLFTDKLPQQQFDLVFDKDFELTHNWKNGSVYFYGYKATNPFEDDEDVPSGESDESDEDIPLTLANSGRPELKAKQEKPVVAEKANASKDKASGSGKKVTIAEPSKGPEEDDESSDEDMMSEDDDDEDDSEDDDDSDESDEETPKKVEPSKKRAAESATKSPASDKKAKVTPQKTDNKKAEVHVDTPHPKKAGKTPAKAGKTPANKPNQQTPKSGGSHTCTSCNRAFGSDKALESHSKAKHAAGK